LGAVGAHGGIDPANAMNLGDLTLIEARNGIASGAIGCAEYAQGFMARVHAHTGLNALVAFDDEALLAAAKTLDSNGTARGRRYPLGGVPLILKDNIDTIQLPTTACTPALRGRLPPRNAPVVQTLFDAGALLGAKSNMHELAFGITSNNACTGAVRNPWNTKMIAGGSSGGSAAAVAARMGPAALGTDTGASVRLPAALCGVVGFRPTVGRYRRDGIVPISRTRDTAGPIARSVEDIALLDGLMSGEAGSLSIAALRGLRIGVPRTHFYEHGDTQVMACIETALGRLSAAGVELVEADIESLVSFNQAVGFPVALYELLQDLPAYLRANAYELSLADVAAQIASPDVALIVRSLLSGGAVPLEAYQKAMLARDRLQASYAAYFRDHRLDAMAFPTSVLPARPIGADETVDLGGMQVPTFATYIRNTDPGSNAGIPGISLPAGLTREGLPVGIELDGAAGSDRRLLSVAAAVERLLEPMPAPP
jgi:indoleacetamide hydrolase